MNWEPVAVDSTGRTTAYRLKTVPFTITIYTNEETGWSCRCPDAGIDSLLIATSDNAAKGEAIRLVCRKLRAMAALVGPLMEKHS